MSARQSRAARALLGWTQAQLAAQAGISIGTIRNFEQEGAETLPAILGAIRRAFEKAGVRFINEAGREGVALRLKTRKAQR